MGTPRRKALLYAGFFFGGLAILAFAAYQHHYAHLVTGGNHAVTEHGQSRSQRGGGI